MVKKLTKTINQRKVDQYLYFYYLSLERELTDSEWETYANLGLNSSEHLEVEAAIFEHDPEEQYLD